MRNRWWVIPGLAAAAVVLAACGSNSAPTSGSSNAPAAAAGAVTIKTMTTSKGTVLTNAAGMTLYWFANDTATMSACTGSCTTYWPPLMGSSAVVSGAKLPHGFGTIKRSNGQTQLTYDGHPLYTYAGDTAAGQINGNDMNLSGGLWWAVTPTGTDLGATTTSSGSGGSSSSSGSSGSGSSGSGSSGSSGGGW